MNDRAAPPPIEQHDAEGPGDALAQPDRVEEAFNYQSLQFELQQGSWARLPPGAGAFAPIVPRR
jgi:hypothetical protein